MKSPEQALVWRQTPTLWVSTFWGAPSLDDAERAIAAYETALAARQRYRHFIDFSRLEHVDPTAFGALAEWTKGVRARAEAKHEWQAIVAPPGMLGAVVCGFHRALDYAIPTHYFDSIEAAVAAMFDGTERTRISRELVPRLAAAGATAPVLEELRAVLAANPTADVAAVAAAMKRSTRTLQRQLAEVGTQFTVEHDRRRLISAKEHLADPRLKIESVAHELGFQSAQYFARWFRRCTGELPNAFRARVTSNRPRLAPKRPR